VTGGGFNIHEVPPLIQNLTAEKLALVSFKLNKHQE
jgi:hypothetical protein